MIKKQASKFPRMVVCFGDPEVHLASLEQAASGQGTFDWWTVNKTAVPGDQIVFYLKRPLSSFVATGTITSEVWLNTDRTSGWYGYYVAEISDVRMLPRPVPLDEVRRRLPEWGFLRQPRRSTFVPEHIVPRFVQCLNVRSELPSQSILEDVDLLEMSVEEGKKKLVRHLCRERNRAIIEAKKKRVLTTVGKLVCEVCGFDFASMFGSLGKGFCEVHHRVPFAQGEKRNTSLDDLAILCSNCHRIIHRTDPMWPVEKLASRISTPNLPPYQTSRTRRR